MSPVPADATGKTVYDLDHAHVFNSWFVQGAFDPVTVARADGCYLWDYDDKRYLDFSSQFVFTNVGYQHPRLVTALVEQAQTLSTLGPNMTNAARSVAAAALADLFPDTHQKVFFTNGGADANVITPAPSNV